MLAYNLDCVQELMARPGRQTVQQLKKYQQNRSTQAENWQIGPTKKD